MILDISDAEFKNILNDEQLFLPIRWDGVSFSDTLEKLFNRYIKRLETFSVHNEQGYSCSKIRIDIEKIKQITGLLIKTITHYLDGFPSKSFDAFEKAMRLLSQTPLQVYQKSVFEVFDDPNSYNLNLFRAVKVGDNRPYPRSRVFHTPYNLRSKVSTSRYSIAGYPSLYLGTSLELCCKEINVEPNKELTIASSFKLERSIEYTNTNVRVIELSIKPQDFLNLQNNREIYRRIISRDLTENRSVREAFFLWYPLIAACSFIRTNKSDPFAAEYIIPQLLMQWVRSEISQPGYGDYNQLIGIRYFSCASVRASDIGFNYVFPTSGQQLSSKLPYCSVLSRAFRLTKPVYLHEYDNISDCEWDLSQSIDIDYISST